MAKNKPAPAQSRQKSEGSGAQQDRRARRREQGAQGAAEARRESETAASSAAKNRRREQTRGARRSNPLAKPAPSESAQAVQGARPQRKSPLSRRSLQ